MLLAELKNWNYCRPAVFKATFHNPRLSGGGFCFHNYPPQLPKVGGDNLPSCRLYCVQLKAIDQARRYTL